MGRRPSGEPFSANLKTTEVSSKLRMIRGFLNCPRLISNCRCCWSNLVTVPVDTIIEPSQAHKADPNPRKINLTIGAYKDDHGEPFLLQSVHKAQQMILDERMNKEYPPLSGVPGFCEAAATLGFGEDSRVIRNSMNCTIQTMSGAGGVTVAAEFLRTNWEGPKEMWISDPSWPNHNDIFQMSGMNVKKYRYFDYGTNGLDFAGLMEDFETIRDRSMVLLHPCGHNPTGNDPSSDQWEQILQVIERKKCCVVFDMAYQGYASGDLGLDASAIRLFTERLSPRECPVLLVQSFSKNMGLYGERAGTLSVVCESGEEKQRVMSNLQFIARRLCSFCPINGARIAERILNDPELKSLWISELKGMAARITSIRKAAVEKLADAGSKRDWSHLAKQIGMFSYTGLNEKEVRLLRDKFSIYMISTGRMSVSGLNTKNIDYFAEALCNVTQ